MAHKLFTSPHVSRSAADILVVDEDPVVVAAIKVTLEGMGDYRVRVAHSGPEGLRMAEKHQPDIILLDMDTPEVDGLSVLRQLRSRSETSMTPVLMISLDAQLNRVAASYQAGANGFVIKPLDTTNLYHQVRSAITLNRIGLLQLHAVR